MKYAIRKTNAGNYGLFYWGRHPYNFGGAATAGMPPTDDLSLPCSSWGRVWIQDWIPMFVDPDYNKVLEFAKGLGFLALPPAEMPVYRVT